MGEGGKGVMAAGELRRTDTQRHTTGVRGRVGERKKGRQKNMNTQQKKLSSYCAQEEGLETDDKKT